MSAAVAEARRWARTYPWLGEDPVPTEPCISEDIYRREVEKVFKKVWLHVGRDSELPEPGCYKLKRLDFASTTVLLIRLHLSQLQLEGRSGCLLPRLIMLTPSMRVLSRAHFPPDCR